MRPAILAVCISVLFLTGCSTGTSPGTSRYETHERHAPARFPGRSHGQPFDDERRRRWMLETIRRSDYRSKRVLNASESTVFQILQSICNDLHLYVFPQVSMGQIIGSDDKKAWEAVRGLVPDFCIVRRSTFQAIAIVEVNGPGHSSVNDERKMEVCRKAGLGYIAIDPDLHPDEIRSKLRMFLEKTIRISSSRT